MLSGLPLPASSGTGAFIAMIANVQGSRKDPAVGVVADPLVVQTHGHAPEFWRGRNVAFFANLLSMFYGNEEQVEELARQISGAECYGGRLWPVIGLLFADGENLLFLEREPAPCLGDYFSGELGLALPEIAVLTHADYLCLARGGSRAATLREQLRERLAGHAAEWVDAYVFDETIASMAGEFGKRHLCGKQGSRLGNNKRLLHEHMQAAGQRVFDTGMADDPAAIPDCLRALAACGYRKAVIKSAIGASGIGLSKVSTAASAPAVPGYFFNEGPCMVQGWVEAGHGGVERVASPSVQLFLDERSVYLFDLTEQILSDDSVHQGNESPPRYLDQRVGLEEKLFSVAAEAGTWLHRQGYRGTASIDFLVAFGDRFDDGCRIYPCEINARVTGATYPSVLARHFLPRGGWHMRNLRFREAVQPGGILQMLDHHGHLFRPREAGEAGVLPINFNLDATGLVTKGQFLCLGENREECHALLQAADRDLPLQWEIDRD